MSKLIEFSQLTIDNICEKSPDMVTTFLAFYHVAIPDFDKVKSLSGFPKASEKTILYCLDKLQKKCGDAWQANSLWLNKGFSSDNSVPDWKISVINVTKSY